MKVSPWLLFVVSSRAQGTQDHIPQRQPHTQPMGRLACKDTGSSPRPVETYGGTRDKKPSSTLHLPDRAPGAQREAETQTNHRPNSQRRWQSSQHPRISRSPAEGPSHWNKVQAPRYLRHPQWGQPATHPHNNLVTELTPLQTADPHSAHVGHVIDPHHHPRPRASLHRHPQMRPAAAKGQQL